MSPPFRAGVPARGDAVLADVLSSAEVEAELLTHADVLEAAVIGVAAELEEDVLPSSCSAPGARPSRPVASDA